MVELLYELWETRIYLFLFTIFISIGTLGSSLVIKANNIEEMSRENTLTTASYQDTYRHNQYYNGAEVYYAILGNDENIEIKVNSVPIEKEDRFEPEMLLRQIALAGTYEIEYVRDDDGNAIAANYIKKF